MNFSVEMSLRNRVLHALLTMGVVPAMTVLTVVSIVMSLVVCGTLMGIFAPHTPLMSWLPFTAITPAVVAPSVSYMIISQAYQLTEAREALANAASTDHLTGIGNRRHFVTVAERDMARARREGSPVSVLMLDIDHFKRLNDRHGHAVGDAALVAVTAACKKRLRETDLICRWGGEEFIVLLPMCPQADAIAVGEHLRHAVQKLAIPGVPEGLTVSVGVAEVNPTENLDETISRADAGLYAAKAAGRNRVRPLALVTA